MDEPAADAARRIVVIEDEEAILDVVVYNLQRAGFEVSSARDGRAGLGLVRQEQPHLVVLDIMLPEVDGIELCRTLRRDATTRTTPVIMLTALGDEADIVHGLDVGADDYVTKPFSPRELVARVEAVLRRRGSSGSTPAAPAPGRADGDDGAPGEIDPDVALATDPARERVQLADVVVDPDRHEVLVSGAPVRLTRTELRLLHVLVRRPGRVYSREQLVARVMGDNAWITDRTIDVHVRAIRRKLGDRADLVETIRGVGYRARDISVAAAAVD